MAYTKHKYKGEDLDKIEKYFKEVITATKTDSKQGVFNLDKEFNATRAMCALVLKMYELNDFVASSYAHTQTVPRINKLLTYMSNNIRLKNVVAWSNEKPKECAIRGADGSTIEKTRFDFLFNVLRNQQLAIAGRYFISENIQYLEKDKPDKDYPIRARILESAVWWVNQGLLGRFGLKMPDSKGMYDCMPEVVIFATFPSSGKSFLVNTCNEMFSELSMIINQRGGFLRVGNEQGNIFRQSRQTMALIENKNIFDIYPENKEFIERGKYNPFNKSSEEEWGLRGCIYDPATSIFKTRDSAINSVRCDIASMDDPSRGQQESTAIEIHKHIVQLYRGDFSDRFKKQGDKFIILTGTMFMPEDVISLEIQNALKDGYLVDNRFRSTYISYDRKTVVIINDCENNNGGSYYKEFISDADLAKKRDGLNAYDYACVWRQKPIPADGLIFDYSSLCTYDNDGFDKLSDYAVSYIDPTRKSAKDFFSMPICKTNYSNGKLRLIDCIHIQKSSRELYEDVIEKIVKHQIRKLVIEENVDASLSDMIKSKLKEIGIRYCEVTTVYNTKSKSERIAEVEGIVKMNVEFPSKKIVPQKSDMYNFMRQFTQYTSVGKNVNDDAPDAMCGLVKEFIVSEDKKNYIKCRQKMPF